MNVAVIGASDKPERYSYQAVKLLIEKGHKVFPVHQRLKSIDGVPVYTSLADIKEPIDTLTMYVSADISTAMLNQIITVNPRRIIFNPGAENSALEKDLKEKGIIPIQACTLVMLRTGQF